MTSRMRQRQVPEAREEHRDRLSTSRSSKVTNLAPPLQLCLEREDPPRLPQAWLSAREAEQGGACLLCRWLGHHAGTSARRTPSMPSKQPERATARVSWGGLNQRRQRGGDRRAGGNARHGTPRSCPRPRFQVAPWSASSLPWGRSSTKTARGMAADNLAKANARGHQSALVAAQDAIEQRCRERAAINFGAVSRAAGVSRAWLYRQADLRERSAACAQLPQRPLLPHNERAPAPCASASPRPGLKSPA